MKTWPQIVTWKTEFKLITETWILHIAFFKSIFLNYLVEIGWGTLYVN